jgi:hypothetical protein
MVFKGPHEGAVATVEPKAGSIVPVLVWEIDATDEAALDRYEGYPFLYRKDEATVMLNGRPESAMLYVMNEGRPPAQPNCGYYSVIWESYVAEGFDTDILRRATENSQAQGGLKAREKSFTFPQDIACYYPRSE